MGLESQSYSEGSGFLGKGNRSGHFCWESVQLLLTAFVTSFSPKSFLETFNSTSCYCGSYPSLPNTLWEGAWTPKHLLRRFFGGPNTSSKGIRRILEDYLESGFPGHETNHQRWGKTSGGRVAPKKINPRLWPLQRSLLPRFDWCARCWHLEFLWMLCPKNLQQNPLNGPRKNLSI